MSKKYKTHAMDVKFKIALEAVKNEKTINQIASEYSVAPSCITDWKKQLLEQGPNIFKIRASIKSPEAHEDVEYLQKQIGKLTIQVDWLKKKSGITC